MLPNLQ
jgi:hypothetical protein